MIWYFSHTRCKPFTCIQCSRTFHANFNHVFGQESESLELSSYSDLAYFAVQALASQRIFSSPATAFQLQLRGDSIFSFGLGTHEVPRPVLCLSCWMENALVIAKKLQLPEFESRLARDYQLPMKGVFSRGQ